MRTLVAPLACAVAVLIAGPVERPSRAEPVKFASPPGSAANVKRAPRQTADTTTKARRMPLGRRAGIARVPAQAARSRKSIGPPPLVRFVQRRERSLAPESPSDKRAGEIGQNGEPWGLKPIGAITTNIRPSAGELPNDLAKPTFQRAGRIVQPTGFSRHWPLIEYSWAAPALCHRPLCFEDVNLERYGYHHGILQPAISAAHFFGRIPAIPYMRGARSPRECVYTLGYYRPGNAVPYYLSRPPISVRGALLEAGAAVGLIHLIP